MAGPYVMARESPPLRAGHPLLVVRVTVFPCYPLCGHSTQDTDNHGTDNQDREAAMAILLDHTIVPAHDNEASAKFFAHIFGLDYAGTVSHFAPVRLNESLVLDFDTQRTFEPHHYAFKVSEPEFEAIFQRVKDDGIAYGSGPRTPDNMAINYRNGGRGFYFKDPNGHLLEVLTA